MVVTLDSETRTADSPQAQSAAQPPAAQESKPATKASKSKRGWSMRLLRKVWLPLVIIIVVAIAAFSVYRLHGVFGKTETTRQGSGLANDTKPFNPKTVVYEIYGPAGTVATVNYLDLDATPQIARDVTLPWSITLTTTAPAASANIVAQGDSDTIGCRIFVNGELKDEKTSTGVNAQTFCLVKSA
jgi:flagellar basal body-associated protein FliL